MSYCAQLLRFLHFLEPDESKTDAVVAKEMRDHKRRRQTYRAKNVHITKRSQTEVTEYDKKKTGMITSLNPVPDDIAL